MQEVQEVQEEQEVHEVPSGARGARDARVARVQVVQGVQGMQGLQGRGARTSAAGCSPPTSIPVIPSWRRGAEIAALFPSFGTWQLHVTCHTNMYGAWCLWRVAWWCMVHGAFGASGSAPR